MALQIGQDCSRVLERAAMNMQAPARGDMWLFLSSCLLVQRLTLIQLAGIFFAVCKRLFTMEVLSRLQPIPQHSTSSLQKLRTSAAKSWPGKAKRDTQIECEAFEKDSPFSARSIRVLGCKVTSRTLNL